MLPDSGADISAAGREFLVHLSEHVDNLPSSDIMPQAVNGTTMKLLGKLPVTLCLGDKRIQDDVHIYPGVSGALISWRAANGLGILPEHCPRPAPTTYASPCPSIHVTSSSQPSPIIDFEKEFPTLFDGVVRNMDGEEFHISLTKDAKLFCVNTPRSIPSAFRNKLKAELDLLQEQKIIAPVTEVMEWCAPIVVTPKKNSDSIRMCVDLSRLNKYVQRECY